MRFHFGVSFRLKYLKKFLFPILIGILAYFGFGLISFIPTYAIYNSNTQYNITIPNYDDYFDDFTCGSENVKDFLHNFIDNFNSNNKHLLIFPITSNDSITISIIAYGYNDTQYNRFYLYTINSNNGPKIRTGYLFNLRNTSSYSRQYVLNLSTCDSNITTSSSWVAFKNFLDNDIYSSNITDNVGSYTTISNDFLYNKDYSTSFSNNSSYDIELNDIFYKSFVWPYYSDRSLQYKANVDGTYSNPDFYLKKFYITNNDTTYNYLDNDIPTFYDIKDTFPDVPSGPTRLGLRDSIDTIYTNFNSSDISNFNLTYSFKVPLIVNSQDYVNNLKFDYYCTSRNIYKDPQDTSNNFLYYYIDEPCSLSYTSTINNDNITYTFNNLSFTNTLSDKKVYLTIKSNYLDNTLSKSIYNVSYTNRVGNFFNTIYRGLIYENFDNLPLNFKLLLSNNGNSINSYVSLVKPNSIYNINYSSYTTNSDINIHNQNNLTIVGNSILTCATNNCSSDIGLTNKDFLTLNVSSSNNSSLMIYQQNSNVILPKLELFFNRGVGVSFGNNSDFYYIDTDGDYLNGSFVEPIPHNNANFVSDNTGSYNNSIVNFINSINDKIIYFQSIVQDVYDGFPVYLQTTLYVLFILFCTYFLYLLIKR